MFYSSKQATQSNFVSSSCGVCKQDRVVIEMICVCTFVKENEEESRWIALCKMQSFFVSKKGVWQMYHLLLLSFITRENAIKN